MRVYEVAEELGLETSHLIQMLREMDILVRSHMSTVEASQVARLHARLERERRGELPSGGAAKPAPSRRRRRRAAPAAIEVEPADAEADEPEPAEGDSVVTAESEAAELEAAEADAEEAPSEVEATPSAEPETVEPAPEDGTAPVAVAETEIPEVAPEEAAEPVSEAETASEGETEPPLPAEVEPAEPVVAGDPPKVRPRPVRRDMPAVPPSTPRAPAAPAAPAGTVRISAEGYTVDGRRKSRGGDRKKRRGVDRAAVHQNVKKTLAAMGGGSPRKRRREARQQQREAEKEQRELERTEEETIIKVNEFLTVSELSDLMGVPASEIITSAFKNLGLMVTINQRLDFDQIELVCEEAGFQAIREEAFEADISNEPIEPEDEKDLVPRPPIVTVMGHVDHGKTSLLDEIRSANVIAGEAGGITQHIGAYHVDLKDRQTITFLDTPGHEAFTAMRARGADLTDIVILVVAADDAVMPQTIEAISHAKNASVPIVVAINKVDLPSANVMKVKQDLLAREVILEEFGGQVLGAEVSAKTGDGIGDLLDKVLLQAELLELKANPERDARGTVVEAQLDRGMGPVATVLVESGTLTVGANFVCGLFAGRVRALLDERGNNVEAAGPGIPVRVLGLEGVPQAGDSLVVLAADRVREIVTRRQQLEREKDIRRRASGTRLEDVFERVQAGEQAKLNIVIKGDTDGSVQALADSLERLSTDEVGVEVIHRAVGGINESDVLLASTSQAIIVGFHVRPDAGAAAAAGRESVEIRVYNVIYEAVEEIRLALEGLLVPEQRDVTVGMAEVRELFRVPKAGTIAGCYVLSGTMRRKLALRLLRDQVQIYEGRMDSLRRFKEDVREVKDGYECGLSIENYNDVKVGDVIECYEVIEVARTLDGGPAR